MRFYLLSALLFASLCHAQPLTVGDPAFVGVYPGVALTPCQMAEANGYVTNITGYPAYAWYLPDCGYATNSNVATLSDLSGNGLDLKAITGAFPIGVPNNLNGHTTITFGINEGSQPGHLTNAAFTVTAGTQCEMFMVCALTNAGSAGTRIIEDDVNDNGMEFYVTGGHLTLYAGSGVSVSDFLTNEWAVFDCVWNGASSTIYTNFVQGLTANAGTSKGIAGVSISFNTTAALQFQMAQLIFYKTNLTSTLRSNVFYTLTNTYASASNPFH